MINLELYKIFYEVAKEENITKASKNLHISQPAITKHIQNLESELNTPLFIRLSKGLKLTEPGQKLFIHVKDALEIIKYAEKEFKDFNSLHTGTINIGASTTLSKIMLLKNIANFHKQYPNIKITISTDPTKQLLEELRKGKLDFILAKQPNKLDNNLSFLKINQLNYIFVINHEYKNLLENNISINELQKYNILLPKEPSNARDIIDGYCKKDNIELNNIMEIASSSLLIDFVKNGYGIGFVTKEFIEQELQNKELFEIKTTFSFKPIEVGIITLKNNKPSLATAKLLNNIIPNLKEKRSKYND